MGWMIGGLDWCNVLEGGNGMVDRIGLMDWLVGVMDWVGGLNVWWRGLADWIDGMGWVVGLNG